MALTVLKKIRDYYSQFPLVRNCAIAYGAPQGNNDTAALFGNLVQFVKDHMTYVADPIGFEYVTAPDYQLGEILAGRQAYGDCDDHVLLLNTLLASVGFETAFVAVKLDSNDELFDHVIASALYNGQWVDVDPCAKHVPQPVYTEKFIVK